MASDDSPTFPKYGCRNCGSDTLGGGLDTFPVFQAKGEVIVYLRSETLDLGILKLFCYQCHEEIEVESWEELTIE